ncbi:RING-H2 finger protein ATL47-like [Andrographis paniculata]|uniref:RING-H2 finger protein ATL47-like n=1 Tax=Andrographis paniculata TaxID=175694 RepID=UPI0021E8696B|nr:RING-H2 finger protein ATL47-like [Andrographis paniculata]
MSRIKISPIVLLVIVILSLGFFMLGVIQLLVRCLTKRAAFSSISRSNSLPAGAVVEGSNSHTFQRQLQQLFRLHDSGLDQSVIDALPVFRYRDVAGANEPFDCAVCLSEFSDTDCLLKLIPSCSHAFHMHCIETWLLSNSTCPLCRGLISCDKPTRPRMKSSRPDEGAIENQENVATVFSISLGKFRSANADGFGKEPEAIGSSSSIDARRCFSMGAFQYVIDGANLRVTLTSSDKGGCKKKSRVNRPYCEDSKMESIETMTDGKRIGLLRSRDDSFSLSKIWLWSKKASSSMPI